MPISLTFFPDGGTLDSGVREPSGAVVGGVARYINLDPTGIADDVSYTASVLPTSATPAWTKGGTASESVSGGELQLSDVSSGDRIDYEIQESGMATASPAYMSIRCKITSGAHASQPVNGGLYAEVWDGTRRAFFAIDGSGAWGTLPESSDIIAMGIGLGTSSYHTYEIRKVKNTEVHLYIDGLLACSCSYLFFNNSTTTKRFSFGTRYYGTGEGYITDVKYKVSTLLPSTSPTAEFIYDSGVDGTTWDMSSIVMLENLYGEAGSITYEYGASNSSPPSLSGSYQDQTALKTESDPTGRYFRLKVKLTGDGSQDAGWGGMKIDVTYVAPAAGTTFGSHALGRGLV